jgi:hypothetical protein
VMLGPGELPTPAEPLYRLGRAPHAVAWPPADLIGSGRFDDPEHPPAFRVLYAGERRACFFEKLAPYRPDRPGVVARPITASWIQSRRIASFTIVDRDQRRRWLDLRSPVTYADFRHRFATEIQNIGYNDFDLMVAANDRRPLTQAIARWAFEQGFSGIRYATRHTPDLSCWAIFEGVTLVEIDNLPVAFDDPDLVAVAESWSIPLPTLSS